ncbi:MAG: nitronate monooxygenase [Sphingobacterium sp.]|nr:nitronate monooxygenase [Sphingobacterium sp.]
MNWSNQITHLLGIAYPIVQAPMFGVTTPEMVAAASRTGALGSLALGDLPYAQCLEAIRATRTLTDAPFAVNIFVNSIPEISKSLKKQYADARSFIETLARQHQLEVSLPEFEAIQLTDYREQVHAILESKCHIVSFTFGNLDRESIGLLKENGSILIGTCTSVEEAQALEAAGIDIICVQGFEAGGHRGSFIAHPIPRIGGLSLLSQVYEQVHKPLIYAGGIYNANTLLATKQLGAAGFQVGSLLLGSKESALLDFEKNRLAQVGESDIVLTRSFSGRYARGIKNAFIEALDNSPYILPYPYQNKLTNTLRKVAKANRNVDFVSIWAGQSIHPYQNSSTEAILKALIQQVEFVAD